MAQWPVCFKKKPQQGKRFLGLPTANL